MRKVGRKVPPEVIIIKLNFAAEICFFFFGNRSGGRTNKKKMSGLFFYKFESRGIPFSLNFETFFFFIFSREMLFFVC